MLSSGDTRASLAPATATATARIATTTATVPATTTPPPPTATMEPPAAALARDDEEEDGTSLVSKEAATPTPEPTTTPTPEPTAVPATPTPTALPATATPAVAVGVPVTPVGGATATPQAAAALKAAGPVAASLPIPASGKVTPYADSLAGSSLGCNGYGAYDPNDATTAAVSDDVNDVPCGTKLELCSTRTCLTVTRKDTCPGCSAEHLDVSRMAFETLCGAVNDCAVSIKKQ